MTALHLAEYYDSGEESYLAWVRECARGGA